MLRLEANQGPISCDGLNRRDFLRVGGLAVGLSLTELARLKPLGAAGPGNRACIQLLLVGGPSQLDTWDPKPDAPAEVRGPFRPINTNVPGIRIAEHFPRMARRADRYAILRSLYHDEAPIHETGHQLLQTGRLSRGGVEWPHCGAVVSRLRPSAGPMGSWAVLPSPIGYTGVSVSHGQTSGFLGDEAGPLVLRDNPASELRVRRTADAYGLDPARVDPTDLTAAVGEADRFVEEVGRQGPVDAATLEALGSVLNPHARRAFDLTAEPQSVRDRYGRTTFGQSCLLARRLVQHGVRLVTVNMFDTVFNEITWDCHANGGDLNTTLDDYATTLCPMFDQAYSALLDDLESLGVLNDTLILAAGEFGRTPKLNGRNGRDHWAGVWSGLVAGGGVRGGQVIGASGPHAEEPRDRPIHPAELVATVYHALGIDPRTRLTTPAGLQMPLVDAEPIRELF